jgi:hypothetical protein
MGAVAVILLMREREVVSAFARRNATSAATAVDPADLGVDLASVGARRLASRAVLREAEHGRWYLDLASWEALRRRRRHVVSVLLFLIALGALYLAGLFPPGAR